MTRINSKILLALALLLFGALAALGGFMVWRLGLLTKELGEIQGRILSADVKLKNLKAFEKILDERRSERAVIEDLFLNEKEIVRFIEDLEEAGRTSGVELEVQSAALAPGPKELGPSFRLSAAGDFNSLFQYLLLAENLPYETAWEQITLQKTAAEGKAPSWSGLYTLKLLSYEF
ncbi:hypothetical protein A3B26_01655 [Candidatus Giovannonibacteria bacterium RIFCSPLOWO2_01_FULL_48_47]|nr:MAG: hypothetical protein A3D61_02925 [Candidatus Giovannonibacteria bacterium RIFCSPHIGHO2_02_FULL_48_15]OGF88414.1 MAG: hypothetical protein A3B26_01655 [Candidatus Giovannonibacteria bacterium RIFCSPLOWO2_01_FULL_48_47]OGF96269.1 MAG: hypothetical protein A2613_01755 [Candidatus Giovannonibacteria bacterium RIFOXYD1_FULL_48_21]HBT81821.1 hypothetical protein [Candidatus Giovannonibacteria bacterium]